MKASVLRALTVAGILALAIAIGHTSRPAGAVATPAPDCLVQPAPSAPSASTALARGRLVPV